MNDAKKSKAQLIEELVALRAQVATSEVPELQDRQAHDLQERVKELNCLYAISDLINTSGLLLPEIFQGVVHLLPPAWQYPEITCARIVVEGQEFLTADFQESPWRQVSAIFFHGKQAGTVEVYYRQEKPACDEGPFLVGERGLIDVIAERLGRVIERIRAEEALRREEEELLQSHQELQAIYDRMFDGLVIADIETKQFLAASPALCRMLGYSEEELLSISVMDVHPPEEMTEVLEKFEAQAAGRAIVVEQPVLRKDGQVFSADIATSQIVYQGRDCMIGIFRDITERKLVEGALRASEEKHRRLIDNLKEEYFIYQHGTDGVFTYLSPSITSVLGYTAEEFKAHYSDSVTIDPINRDVVRFTELAIEGKQQPPYEVEVQHKDGSIRRLEVLEIPIFDEQGKVTCVEGIAHDITERKQAEEALQESKERYRSLVETTSDWIWEVDSEGVFTYSSPQAKSVLGYEAEEIVGKTPFELATPEELNHVVEFFRETVAARRPFPAFENTCLHKDGHRVVIETTGAPVFDAEGNLVRYRGVNRDITGHKQAQDALRESEEKFRTLYETTSDAVMLLDEKSFFDCNEATLHIFGCASREEFCSKHPADLSPARQPDGTDSLTLANERIATAMKEGTNHFEWMHQRTDGTEFPADVLLSALEMGGKQVLQAVVRDITERKRIEEALRRERRVLRQLLEAGDRDRKLIAYEIHDGIAQQLAAVMMHDQTYQQLQEEDPREALKARETAQKTLKACIAETRRLISKVRLPLLDEAGVVAAVQDLAYESNNQPGPEVEFHSGVQFGRLEPVLENSIYRIVQESLTNARQHSQSEKVQISLGQKDGHVYIEVRDWGIGFDTEKVQGKVYGLSGIRERARLLGGHATIESTPGEGTHVVVELPLVMAG